METRQRHKTRNIPENPLPAKSRDALDGLPNLVVGGRCARRNPNRQPAFRQPPLATLFGRMGAHRPMAVTVVLYVEAGSMLSMVRRCPIVEDCRQMRSVARAS